MAPTNIAIFTWNNFSNAFGPVSDDAGPLYKSGGFVSFQDGNDSLYGSYTDSSGIWFYDSATVDGGRGADTINGSSANEIGILIEDGAVLLLGDGADVVLASSYAAQGLVISEATINAGNGNDWIGGESVESIGTEIDLSRIELGSGNDALGGRSELDNGLDVFESEIYGGNGNDFIFGESELGDRGISLELTDVDTGAGSDDVVGYGDGVGIYALDSEIDLSTGNDELYASAGTSFVGEFGEFVPNLTVSVSGLTLLSSELYGGSGNDCVEITAFVDASGSNCSGDAVGVEVDDNSLIDLGTGNDTLLGEAWSTTDTPFSTGNPTSNATAISADLESSIVGGSGNDAFEGYAFAAGEDATATGLAVTDGSTFDAGTGNDLLVTYAAATTYEVPSNNTALPEFSYSHAFGVLVDEDSELKLGNGNDSIRADAYAKNNSTVSSAEDTRAIGIYIGVESSLTGGNGKNSVIGNAIAESNQSQDVTAIGIQVSDDSNEGSGYIELGNGIDTLIGTAKAVWTGNSAVAGGETIGILNAGGSIDMGSGNDVVLGDATNDEEGDSAISTGIKNTIQEGSSDFGEIDLGDGNDKLTGEGEDYGIWNDGVINAGRGNDIIDAREGGFYTTESTTAEYNLGDGNDTVFGYGAGEGDTAITFNGGNGDDVLRLEAGKYTFTSLGGGNWQIKDSTNTPPPGQPDSYIIINGFEFVGGYTGVLTNLATGITSGNDYTFT